MTYFKQKSIEYYNNYGIISYMEYDPYANEYIIKFNMKGREQYNVAIKIDEPFYNIDEAIIYKIEAAFLNAKDFYRIL